jgi:undecaprenyl-diphosphatase
MYEFFYGADSINRKLFMAINHADSPFLDMVMPVVTFLGGSRIVYFYILLLTACYLVNKEFMPGRYLVVYAVATLASIGAEELLKGFFHVPRPVVAIGLEQVRVLGKVSRSYAIPSGHAVFSFMTAYTLSYGRTWRWKGILYAFALLVAWSRIYVGAHYPLDVVAGGMVGVVCSWIVWKVYELSGMRLSSHPRT